LGAVTRVSGISEIDGAFKHAMLGASGLSIAACGIHELEADRPKVGKGDAFPPFPVPLGRRI